MLRLLRPTTRATSRLLSRPCALPVPAFRRLASTGSPRLATLETSNASRFRALVDEWCFYNDPYPESQELIAKAKAGIPFEPWESEHFDTEESFISRIRFLYSGEIQAPKPGETIDTHPIFCFIEFHQLAEPKLRAAEEPVFHYSLDNEDLKTDISTFVRGNIYKDSAIDELATFPACTKLRLRIMGEEAGVVENAKGVTVRQLLDLARQYFNTPLKEEAKEYARRCLTRTADETIHIGDCLPTSRHFQRSHTVEEDGSVVVEYKWFHDWRAEKLAELARQAKKDS